MEQFIPAGMKWPIPAVMEWTISFRLERNVHSLDVNRKYAPGARVDRANRYYNWTQICSAQITPLIAIQNEEKKHPEHPPFYPLPSLSFKTIESLVIVLLHVIFRWAYFDN